MTSNGDKSTGTTSTKTSGKPAASKSEAKSTGKSTSTGSIVQQTLKPVTARTAGTWPDDLQLVHPEKKDSDVWKYFQMEKVEKGVKNIHGQTTGYGNVVYCILCKPSKKKEGAIAVQKKSGTSHYLDHLKSKHQSVYDEIMGITNLAKAFGKGVRK